MNDIICEPGLNLAYTVSHFSISCKSKFERESYLVNQSSDIHV